MRSLFRVSEGRAVHCIDLDTRKMNKSNQIKDVIPLLGEEGTFALGEHATVCNCKLYAILMLAYRLTELDLGDISEIRIFTDSLSSLKVCKHCALRLLL